MVNTKVFVLKSPASTTIHWSGFKHLELCTFMAFSSTFYTVDWIPLMLLFKW
ncbi:hypothetical protein SERLADRAFT_379104 [Serpula lacrymans var. lacrymans S7.9]|uniref:Uncharacterized protein n=1 Tax=Serpula lacrymans var. lacrymans (strain S7.9) TaxID=578457 RepID=F8NI26_SERL9|nr:uncharacterized protein SERLADRAFT_379104 [Serpula lacrymans var. lacrymans S7.9]EGO29748.1 hypothetical protein SERLADRAFT_379104 [Serpula lacrymans var. lacrymans S7.9]